MARFLILNLCYRQFYRYNWDIYKQLRNLNKNPIQEFKTRRDIPSSIKVFIYAC